MVFMHSLGARLAPSLFAFCRFFVIGYALMPIYSQAFDAKFVPPEGKLRMFIGQDSETIEAYGHAVPEDALEGITLYTSVYSTKAKLSFEGVYAAADWDAGRVDYSETLSSFPDAALAIGLIFSDRPDLQEKMGYEIAEGKHDAEIKKFAEYLKQLAPRPIFLRIGYEFDGFWFAYRPESYVKAFRHIHSLLEQVGAENVVTVWQAALWPDHRMAGEFSGIYNHGEAAMLDRWYPGDDVVDWMGMSVFYRDLSQWDYVTPLTPAELQERFLFFAREKNKPVLIAESAPQGYRNGKQSGSTIMYNQPTPLTAEAIWRRWYEPYFDFIYSNKDIIRSVAYINTDWDSQKMWECKPGGRAGEDGCAGGNWGDSRIQANSYIKSKWLEQVLDDSIWLQGAK